GLLARRVDHASLQRPLRTRCRTTSQPRARQRRRLVLFSIHRSQHLPLDPPQPAQAPLRLADHVLRHHCRPALPHSELTRVFPQSTFSLESSNLWVEVAIYATSVMVIGTELKIFNGVRIQMKLEEQHLLLLQARMEALQNQINPHFLFNTLNSVSSLVRFDPDTARELIIKLARILRRLLNSSDSFVPLKEEVEFIDNYLDIEVVRFGRDKLRVVKELEPESLEMLVPAMLLQPLVENSIKHGLSSKIEGGSIYLR